MAKYKKKSKINTEKKNPLNRRKKIPANVAKNFNKLYSRKLQKNMLLLGNKLSNISTVNIPKKEPN